MLHLDCFKYWNLEDLLNIRPYQTSLTPLEDILEDLDIDLGVETLPETLEELWTKVFNKYSTCTALETLENISPEDLEEEVYRFFVKFINKYEDTKDYYEPLIAIYTAKKDSLMAQIEASTENEVIFNDTPQTSNGVLSGDTYATTYTKTRSTTQSDMKSPIERIKDIQETLRNYWSDWVKEFLHIFLED